MEESRIEAHLDKLNEPDEPTATEAPNDYVARLRLEKANAEDVSNPCDDGHTREGGNGRPTCNGCIL